MDRIHAWLAEWKTRLAAILGERDAALSEEAAQLAQQKARFEAAVAQLKRTGQEDLAQKASQSEALRRQAELRGQRRQARIEAACTSLKKTLEEKSRAHVAAAQKHQREAHALAVRQQEQQAALLNEECAQARERLATLRAASAQLRTRAAEFAREHGLEVDAPRAHAGQPAGAGQDAQAMQQRLAELETALEAARKNLRKRVSPLVPYLLVTLFFGGAAAGVYRFTGNALYVFIVLLALVLGWVVVYSAYYSLKEKVWGAAQGLCHDADALAAAIAAQEQAVSDREAAGLDALENKRILHMLATDEKTDPAQEAAKQALSDAFRLLQTRRDEQFAKIACGKKAEWEKLTRQAQDEVSRLQEQNRAGEERLRAEHAAQRQELEAQKKNTLARLAADWREALAALTAFAEDARRQARESHPHWDRLAQPSWRMPTAFSENVYAGEVAVPLKSMLPAADADGPFSISASASVSLPATLSFPLRGSLLVQAGPKKRDEAAAVLFRTALRALCSFPPGKAKLTILDPVGLGQNFAALMNLSDYDETLVGGRIWSETTHIEQRLTELTEHMEKVIQKYLRNHYACIDDYNREAGQMAEAYRFLLIADFPAGFSELALERLASIVSSGVRCGVYTIILHDRRQPVPPALDEALLKRNGLAIAECGEHFIVDDAALNRGEFIPEQPPAPPQLDALLAAIGKQCREAARVEVPFESVAPKKDAVWDSGSETSIRIPLGKAGADRLQFMELGRGTAQHALIAGKTGSGKSNLFHVIITNAALWYSPRELEFYLIDFKKGVEFKTYGTHRLPHARVIAVESDREFGLSVLRRLDRELTRRGELFRKARVQDLPSYRKNGATEHLPRTLLIIDEFQEFFTEDDGVAQDAALLLDRIVRQGRAFGIHVILGSQTLGGTYTLAKSTLGQMAVRIALQCTETDSYLILSDDNAAARLLSRPGEAIYNDMSGLIEGNNPFQAVFLAKEIQDQYLAMVQRQAEAAGIQPPPDLAIFEGNAPADLRNNLALREMAKHGRAAETPPRVWLGEANAIKGPTEAVFIPQAGSNLLCVGARTDASLALCSAAIVSLAAQHAPADVRIVVLDGTTPDSGVRERLGALGSALPHPLELIEYRRVPEAVSELAAQIKTRQEDSGRAGNVYLLVLGLEKFRMLRQGDDFGFSEEGDGSPVKAFADILSDGPAVGVHTLLWCDTLNNLNRTLNRKTLREFETRVLFQMSAADSSELIDNPAANNLGLYNAILFTSLEGSTEKFRPYAAPEADVIQELARVLRAREVPAR